MKVLFWARVAAVAVLGGCSSVEPMTFDFKWFEDDPAYSWLVGCTGEPPQAGASYAGRIEIVDPKLMRRLARMESWDKLNAEDLKGMRCAPPSAIFRSPGHGPSTAADPSSPYVPSR